ncbi:MAG: Ig-like domain-containing protein, partial [bacterium]
MKQRNLCTTIAITAALLLTTGCGGGGGYGGGSSGGGGGGGSSAVAITPVTSTIAVNATQQYSATTEGASSAQYTWKSSNTSVATIDSKGLATALAAGTANITATSKYTISGYPYTATSNTAKLTVSASGMVMGTAATGRPFAGALISLKDVRGHTLYTTTDTNGRFSLSVSGLTSPFLLAATDNRGHMLYSSGNHAGVVNIDPFTDAMTRTWYQSHGTTVEAAFENPGTQPAADDASLKRLNTALADALDSQLVAQELDPSSINLISTPFTADGSGLDGLLDLTSFSMQGSRI